VLNQAPRHEGVLGEWRGSSKHSLTSVLDGGDLLASHPGRFTPSEGAPSTHWIGRWVGPSTSLDAVGKRKILTPAENRTPIQYETYIASRIQTTTPIYSADSLSVNCEALKMKFVGGCRKGCFGTNSKYLYYAIPTPNWNKMLTSKYNVDHINPSP
jgi:hypothetical protein